jgi:predicted transposase/invertase (TIGR01784 family)
MLEANLERWKEEIYQQGVIRGVKKGVQQGARQALLETARKLKARSVTIEEIIDITGLSRAEIEAL